MNDEPKPVTLAEIAEGAAEIKFQEAMRKVLENCYDVNTPWKKSRKITLEFEFFIDEERKHAYVDLSCVAKLVKDKPVETIIHIGPHKGELVAVEAASQRDLFKDPVGRPEAVQAGGPQA